MAVTAVLQAEQEHQKSGSVKKGARKAALESFHSRLQQFHAACDFAQEYVDNFRHQLMAHSLFDEARGAPPVTDLLSRGPSDPTLSVERMEQLSRVIEGMVEDLHHPPTAPTTQHASPIPMDRDGSQGGSVLRQEQSNVETQELK